MTSAGMRMTSTIGGRSTTSSLFGFKHFHVQGASAFMVDRLIKHDKARIILNYNLCILIFEKNYIFSIFFYLIYKNLY